MNFNIFKSTNYEVRFKCTNCKHLVVIKIPKGLAIKDFVHSKEATCPICGSIEVTIVNPELLK